MIVARSRGRRRRGGTLVEMAVISIVALSMLFAIFEYGRMLMDLSLLDNATREGCRYALVNNTDPTITADVQTVVMNYMAGENASFNNFTVSVTGTHAGVATAVNNLGPGDMITVSVSGTYKFMNIVPILEPPSNLNLTSTVTMLCEGGT